MEERKAKVCVDSLQLFPLRCPKTTFLEHDTGSSHRSWEYFLWEILCFLNDPQ